MLKRDEAVLEHRSVKSFKAMVVNNLKSPGNYYFEELDGSQNTWVELSATAKLQDIASYAAMCNVPFKAFAEVAREVIGDDVDAALQVVLEHQKELHGLAKLLPDDGRIESTPLIDQLKQLLAYVAKLETKEEEHEHYKDTLFKANDPVLDGKPLDGAKALKDILRGDYPKQKEAKTKDNGREI